MLSVAVFAVLCANPAAARAKSLADAARWEELYLAYASATPESYPAADSAAMGLLFARGCEALAPTDAVLAFSFGDLSTRFGEPERGVLCLARAGIATDQRSAAQEALERGLKRYPNSGALAVELGRLLLGENDPEGALRALERVSAKSPFRREAQQLLVKARAAQAASDSARRQIRELETAQSRREGSLPARAGAPRGRKLASEPGMRERDNDWFRLRYFKGARDFAQRADYEGRVLSALDEAREAVRRHLGLTRRSPLDVVLYTKEEFAQHLGRSRAQAIAGFYSEGAIRINDAAEMSLEARATLTHEYVHAVVDELCDGRTPGLPVWVNEGAAELVEWRFMGRDGPAQPMAGALRSAASAGQLPRLAELARGPYLGRDGPLRYAMAGVAARLLVSMGPERLEQVLRDVASGVSFSRAFETRFDKTLGRFEEELGRELERL